MHIWADPRSDRPLRPSFALLPSTPYARVAPVQTGRSTLVVLEAEHSQHDIGTDALLRSASFPCALGRSPFHDQTSAQTSATPSSEASTTARSITKVSFRLVRLAWLTFASDDFAVVLQRARDAGVSAQLLTGGSLSGSRKVLALAESHGAPRFLSPAVTGR